METSFDNHHGVNDTMVYFLAGTVSSFSGLRSRSAIVYLVKYLLSYTNSSEIAYFTFASQLFFSFFLSGSIYE